MIVVVSIGLFAFGPTPAHADGSCLVPVGCDTELDLDDPLQDPGDVVQDPVGTVDDIVDGVDETVGPVIDQVDDLLDDVLGRDPGDPPGGGPDGDDPDPVVDGRDGARGRPSADASGTPDAVAREGARPETLIGSAASGTRPAVGPARSPGGDGDVVEAALRGLLLLAVLFGLAIGFVVAQSRLDRRDPRLAGAPARAEVVTFG
jgi:hypothetical protein